MRNKILALAILMAMVSCNNNYVPKPEGYLRVIYPEKDYLLFNAEAPFSFEYPAYATLRPHQSSKTEPYWYDMNFPAFKATLYLSYKHIEGDLGDYIEDARTLVYKHASRSDGIDEIPVYDEANKRFGIMYDLKGNVASPFQFFITDSTSHYLRGSLYFNVTPNRDSLNPVLTFVKEDIVHLIETTRWIEVPGKGSGK